MPIKFRKKLENITEWIAIGDIHSEYDHLLRLLKKLEAYKGHRLIFLGDYFGGEKGFSEVLHSLYKLDKKSELIIGNHDLEFLNSWNMVRKEEACRRKFLDYFSLDLEIVEWFEGKLIRGLETDNAFFSHAGLDDRKKINKQTLYDLTNSCYRGNLDHVTDKLIIQGHLPLQNVKLIGNHYFIDTFCGIGGVLSALVFPEMLIITSN